MRWRALLLACTYTLQIKFERQKRLKRIKEMESALCKELRETSEVCVGSLTAHLPSEDELKNYLRRVEELEQTLVSRVVVCGGVVSVEGWCVWRGGGVEGWCVWRSGACGGVVCVEGWCVVWCGMCGGAVSRGVVCVWRGGAWNGGVCIIFLCGGRSLEGI